MSSSALIAGTDLKNCRNGRKRLTMLSALNAAATLLRRGHAPPSTSRAADGCQKTNKMEININMQGWFAVIVQDACVAAFVEYEDAMKYKKTLEQSGLEVVVEKIVHKRG